ncbi:unnamed protein product [Closterium sp. NIES-53]
MIGLSEAQRFNGSDYGTWRLKFIRRAREVGLWRLYHPTKGEEDAPPSETASAQVKAAYRRKSEQAYFQLCHSVSDAIAVGLDQFADDLNSAEKAWSYMDAVYLGRSDTNLTAIKRKLLLLGMEPAESVIDYVNRAKSYNECLAAMGAAEPESHMVSYIINGLPKDWVGEKGVLTCNPPKDITRLLEMLQSLEQIRYNGVQRETLLPVKGEGDLVLRSPYGELKLDNVLLVEKLTLNLISQSQLDSNGCKTFSDNGKLWVFDSDWKVVAEGARKEGLYEMCLKECNKAAETTFQAEPEEGKVAREELRAMLNKIPVAVLQQQTPPLAAAVEGITMETLHRRMGHASDQRINELLDKNMAVGVKVSKGEKEKLKCGACVEGKSTRTSHPKHGTRQPYETLEIVAADICGPMRVASRHGSKYFITFTDLGTRHTWVTEIKEKSEALSSFIDWLAEAERQSGKELKVLRTDNGGEFLNTDFNSYLRTKGIRRQLTIPYTPQHNSVAERVNRSLLESVRSMLSDSGLPLSYWGDALGMACWLKNRLPTTGLAADITPHEAFYHRKPSLEFLRVWGCMTQYRELAGPDHKLLPRTKWGVHLGICPVSKGWVIKNVDSGKVTATRDVIFYENLNYREWKDGAKAHAATDKSTNPQPVQELLGSGADGIGTASDVSAAELEDDDSPVTWVWETTPTTEGDTVAEPEGQPGDAATRLAADITPHEAFYHRKPSLEFLRVWGCMTQYREPAGPDHKLLPRTKWGVHLGICPVSKGWVIKNVDNGKVTATRDVIFYENLNYREWKDGAKAHAATDKSTNPQPVQELLGSGADGIGTASDVSAAELEDDDSPVTWVWETTPTTEGDTVAEPEGQPGDAATSGQQSDQARNDQQPPATSEASDPWRLFDADSSDEATGEIDSLLEEGAILIGREEEEQQDESQGPTEAEAESPAPAAQEEELGRGMRIKRSNQRYAMILMTCWRDVHTHLLLTTTATALISKEQRTTYDLPPEPVTIEEALTGPYKEKWRAAIQAELDTLAERGTWELVKMPEGRRPVGVKWVFKIKTGDIGQLERFKARLVAKGYTQVEGVDYGKTYASVCNLTTARTFLKVTAARDYHMVQLDITNAFLYAILKEDIYMNQPPGWSGTRQ